jgi:hypothetical protein
LGSAESLVFGLKNHQLSMSPVFSGIRIQFAIYFVWDYFKSVAFGDQGHYGG